MTFGYRPIGSAFPCARVTAASSGTLRDDLTDYFKSEIRWATPRFSWTDRTRTTSFHGHRQARRARTSSATGIGAIARPHGLALVFERNTGTRRASSPSYRTRKGPGLFQDLAGGKCTSAAAAKEHFVESTLRMLNEDRRLRKEWRYHPTWQRYGRISRSSARMGLHGGASYGSQTARGSRLGDRLRYKSMRQAASAGLRSWTPIGRLLSFPHVIGVPVEDGPRHGSWRPGQQLVHEYIHPQTDHRLNTDGRRLTYGPGRLADPVGSQSKDSAIMIC